MKLIVNGDFPKTGTIAKIVGYPGLSEDTTALMNFDLEKSIFWGASTNSSTSTGVFTLLLNCNDQIIIHTDAQIQNISPNPATNNAIVEIDSKEESVYEIILSTNSGKVLRTEKINLMSGTNIINFDSSEFDSGNYIISLKKGGIVSSKNLIIIK